MNIQQLEQQIDLTIFSLKQKLKNKNNNSTNSLNIGIPSSTTTTSPILPYKRTNSLKSLKKLIIGKENNKLFNNKKEEEDICWTAPVSPQINYKIKNKNNSSFSINNISPNIKRKNSAKLKELQRLLKAYHEQKDWKNKEENYINKNLSSYSSLYLSNNNNLNKSNSSINLLKYSKSELGEEKPFFIIKEEEENNKNNLIIKRRKSGLEAQKQQWQRMITLSQLELQLKGKEKEEKEIFNNIYSSSNNSLEIFKNLEENSYPQIIKEIPKKPPRRIKYSNLIENNNNKEEENSERILNNSEDLNSQKISKKLKTKKEENNKKENKKTKIFGLQQLFFGNKQKEKNLKRKELPQNNELIKMANSEPKLLNLPQIQNNLNNIFSRQISPIITNKYSSSSPLLDATLSLSLSNFALEYLEKLKEFILETKYVTAVFETFGGFNLIIEDIENELIHWIGVNSKLLAVAFEVHWSVPEKYRNRQMDIKLKECLHSALRENNRRILGLNSSFNEDIEDQLNSFNISQFPLVLAKSRTEESCSKDVDTDSFQGIYRRFYPALLSLQDKSTVDAHKGYWTLENLTSESKSPLIPNPERFLFRSTPGQLIKRSVVALNLAVLRIKGDNRDYDNDEQRIKEIPKKRLIQSNF